MAEVVLAEFGEKIELECLPRASPITHRHFDLTGLAKSFPDFSPIPLQAGISETISGMAEGA